jgi:two-component system, chemotaxis family, sensor kinase Cph1
VTNAAKFGALSTPHGRVEVNWDRGADEDGANLSIVWREIGGPTVAASPNCKYGVSIIRDLIPNELGGSVDLAFAAGGVSCKIEIPLGVACAETGRPRGAPLKSSSGPSYGGERSESSIHGADRSWP